MTCSKSNYRILVFGDSVAKQNNGDTNIRILNFAMYY